MFNTGRTHRYRRENPAPPMPSDPLPNTILKQMRFWHCTCQFLCLLKGPLEETSAQHPCSTWEVNTFLSAIVSVEVHRFLLDATA